MKKKSLKNTNIYFIKYLIKKRIFSENLWIFSIIKNHYNENPKNLKCFIYQTSFSNESFSESSSFSYKRFPSSLFSLWNLKAFKIDTHLFFYWIFNFSRSFILRGIRVWKSIDPLKTVYFFNRCRYPLVPRDQISSP